MTAAQILAKQDKLWDNENVSVVMDAEDIYTAMKEYAQQEVEKALEIASEKAKVEMNEGGESIETQIALGYVFVDKSSILGCYKVE